MHYCYHAAIYSHSNSFYNHNIDYMKMVGADLELKARFTKHLGVFHSFEAGNCQRYKWTYPPLGFSGGGNNVIRWVYQESLHLYFCC